jgi:RimJ/RimL family protein N-acetyltransferase
MQAVKFAELSGEEYSKWRDKAVEKYALDKVRAGNLEKDAAIEASRKEFEAILPNGLFTKDNYFFAIRDPELGENVGIIWFNTNRPNEPKSAFIYDIEIDEKFRGKGYGSAALVLLESKVQELGKNKISLHVFGYNTGAIKLYSKLGYVTTNVLMSKDLATS